MWLGQSSTGSPPTCSAVPHAEGKKSKRPSSCRPLQQKTQYHLWCEEAMLTEIQPLLKSMCWKLNMELKDNSLILGTLIVMGSIVCKRCSSKRYIEAPTSGIWDCKLIWKSGHCGCNEIQMRSWDGQIATWRRMGRKNTMWARRQRSDWCECRPRSTKDWGPPLEGGEIY